jgi:hypothetical protein
LVIPFRTRSEERFETTFPSIGRLALSLACLTKALISLLPRILNLQSCDGITEFFDSGKIEQTIPWQHRLSPTYQLVLLYRVLVNVAFSCRSAAFTAKNAAKAAASVA